jgi:hypothetical protein
MRETAHVKVGVAMFIQPMEVQGLLAFGQCQSLALWTPTSAICC